MQSRMGTPSKATIGLDLVMRFSPQRKQCCEKLRDSFRRKSHDKIQSNCCFTGGSHPALHDWARRSSNAPAIDERVDDSCAKRRLIRVSAEGSDGGGSATG